MMVMDIMMMDGVNSSSWTSELLSSVQCRYRPILPVFWVLFPGINGIGMWSGSRLFPTHVNCFYVGVVPSLLCGSPCAGLAAAAVADGNIADVIPRWGLQENSGAEWRWREDWPTPWGLWAVPPGARWGTDPVAQQVVCFEFVIKKGSLDILNVNTIMIV